MYFKIALAVVAAFALHVAANRHIVSTWNIGLEEKWPVARTLPIIDTLRDHVLNTPNATHVLCLTEVWGGPKRMKQVLRGIEDVLPFRVAIINPTYLESDSVQTTYPSACQKSDFTCSDASSIASCILHQCILRGEAEDTIKCFQTCTQSCLAVATTSACGSCLVEQAYAVYALSLIHI